MIMKGTKSLNNSLAAFDDGDGDITNNKTEEIEPQTFMSTSFDIDLDCFPSFRIEKEEKTLNSHRSYDITKDPFCKSTIESVSDDEGPLTTGKSILGTILIRANSILKKIDCKNCKKER